MTDEVFDRKTTSSDKRPEELADLFDQWRFIARADQKKSAFFETNSAQPVLSRYNVRFVQNRTIFYFDESLEESFKSCMEQARRTVFISYLWSEARRFAIAFAREFRKQGLSPWLDALSIPEYEAKGDPGVNRQRLEKLIEMGIAKSALAVVINTKTFGESDWTIQELEHILENRIPWFQVMRGGRERDCGTAPIFKRKPEEVIMEILKKSFI